MKGQFYQIADIADIDLLKSQLSQYFTLVDEIETRTRFEVLDSFDWRLYRNGWELIHNGHHWEIVDLDTEQMVGTIVLDNDRKKKFCWDFPVSDFSALLYPILEMRALLHVVTIARQTTRLNLCNNDEKIVARLEIESFHGQGDESPVYRCRPVPVRGYHKELKLLQASIDALTFPLAKVSPVFTIIEINGVTPGSYSSKINISLAPALPTAEAVRQIMESLVEVMHLNLPGVRQDIDSEFLHDFRVSVRRSRSLLGQLKGVLDPETTASLQAQLKSMGAITGNVRDLDVYLLEESVYSKLVPEELRPGIVQLFRTLKKKRRYAKDRMIKAMNGEEFSSSMKALDDYISSDPLGASDTPGSTQPIFEIAKTVIYKRYRRIVKKGRKITETTPDEKLHELRIDCKKLRYLLEFFSSLFPKEEMKKLIKQLKQLQENLGAFNDLSVQQEFLVDHLNSIKPQTSQVLLLSAAIGALVARLETAHQHVRSQFLHVFIAFNTPGNQKRFKTLFT